jgi:poly-gamma-glutamate system protein
LKLKREFDWFGTSGQIWILAAWAILVGILVWTPGNEVVTMDESRLLDRVFSAQRTLHEKRVSLGTASPRSIDPSDSGLIGVEWSTITTTAGDLGSKILSVKPGWAVVFRRWLDNEGLSRGDRITILSSGSFPGLAVSAIAAAESLDLDINLLVSLGSSAWGANIPDMTLTDILAFLRKEGFISTRANACTLGAGWETGRGLAPEGIYALRASAIRDGIPVIEADSLEEMIRVKGEAALIPGTRFLVQIGGGQADLGTDPSILDMPPGIIKPSTIGKTGNGIVAEALKSGIPVLHVLNIPLLARGSGLYGRARLPAGVSPVRLIAALGSGIFVLWRFRRWEAK